MRLALAGGQARPVEVCIAQLCSTEPNEFRPDARSSERSGFRAWGATVGSLYVTNICISIQIKLAWAFVAEHAVRVIADQ